MARTTAQKNKDNLDTRDKVNSIDQTVRELILPALNDIKVDMKRIVEKDYLTVVEANERYATRDRVKRLEDKLRPVLKGLGLVGTAIAVTLVGIVINFVVQGGLSK